MTGRESAFRVLSELIKAAEGNYFTQGWASYIARADVEACALALLTPTERAVYHKFVDEALGV